MTQALLVAGGLFLLVYLPLATLAWRRPLLARFAWREAKQSRGQFALLVVGLMVGSASITASLVGADSGIQTLTSLTDQRLGAVDLTVTRPSGTSFSIDVARQLAAEPALTPYIDGVQAGVEVPASVADLDQRLGKANVLLVGFDPDSQPRFGAYLLTDGRRVLGDDLAPGEVILSGGLASALDAHAGDHLRIASGSGSGGVDTRVYGIATASGPGSYGSFLAAYTTLASAQLIMGEPSINIVRIAARGGTPASTEAARRAAAPLRSAISRIPFARPLVVNELRLDAAGQLGGWTAGVLGPNLGFSALTVLAAIALIVNLVLTLAEERRSRLAVLRALGLTRAGLVALSTLEGAIYSLAAATVGVAAGVPAGLYLATQLWNSASADPLAPTWVGFPLQLTIRPGTIALAFAAGALITLGTFGGAAYQTSRMAIASAIRDLPDPASAARHRWPRTVLLVVVAVVGAALLVPDDLRIRTIGGVGLIATLSALARGRLPDRARFTFAGVLLATWAAIMATGVRGTADLYQVVTVIFLVVAVAAVGLTVAATANLKLIDAAVGLAGSRAGLLQATLRPSLAYLSRRPIRTGLAISAFALVLALVSGIALVASGPKPDYAQASAGFDVEVVTSGPNQISLPPELEAQVAAELALPMRLYRGSVEGQSSSVPVTFYVLPDQPLDAAPVYLSSSDSRFASAAEVWKALHADPRMAVDANAGLGDSLTLRGVNGPIRLRIAGHEGPPVLQGIIVAAAALDGIDTRPVGSTLLIKAKIGADPGALARQIERTLFEQGVQATAVREILDESYTSGMDYTTEYDVLLHMGLLVAVLALAMIGIRAAIERRRAIGILRALGYQPSRVLAGLLAEATLAATLGVATGIGAGVLMVYFLSAGSSTPGTPEWGVFFARLGIALAIVYGTVLLVTLPLVTRASRMTPADAIRLTG